MLSGLIAQSSWVTVQLFLHGGSFGIADPEFGHDIGFYVFDLPFYRLVLNWLFVAVFLAFLASLATHYLFGGLRLTTGKASLRTPARIQLAVLAGTFILLKAVAYWLDRYSLLSSSRKEPTFTGAGYTDINAGAAGQVHHARDRGAVRRGVLRGDLPARPADPGDGHRAAGAVVDPGRRRVAAADRAVLGAPERRRPGDAPTSNATSTRPGRPTESATTGSTTATIPGWAPKPPRDVPADVTTIANARLLDPNVLSRTFTQQQQLKNFYGFPENLDIDRYRIDGELRDYIVAARELSPNSLSGNQTDWINRHTVYTHGDGFVAAPANRVNAAVRDAANSADSNSGYPIYAVSDIASQGSGQQVDPGRPTAHLFR